MANQALSLDSWSHWTLIRPLESSSPRESIMPLNDAKNPQLTLQAWVFYYTCWFQRLLVFWVLSWEMLIFGGFRRKRWGALSQEMLYRSFGKAKHHDLISRCCFGHSFVTRVQRIGVLRTSQEVLGSGQSQGKRWIALLQEVISCPPQAAAIVLSCSIKQLLYAGVQNDIVPRASYLKHNSNSEAQIWSPPWVAFTVPTDML